jgi:hypothetical protein
MWRYVGPPFSANWRVSPWRPPLDPEAIANELAAVGFEHHRQCREARADDFLAMTNRLIALVALCAAR